MAPKKGSAPVNIKIENPIAKFLNSVLRDYERMCSEFGCSACPKIRETLRKGINDETIMKTFVMDPKDRRKVEYWDDKQFVEWFDNGCEEPRQKKKQKPKKKNGKTEKPLGSMVAKGTYELEYIELIDCFINEKALDAFAPHINFTKTLTDLILDFNEELFVDGNQLEAEGAIALLTQLAEAATQEGFERERLKQEKIDALEAEKLAGRTRVDLGGPLDEAAAVGNQSHATGDANKNNATGMETGVSVHSDADRGFCSTMSDYTDSENTNVNAAKKGRRETKAVDEFASVKSKGSGNKKKKRRKHRKGGKAKKLKMPPAGPQISHLHMAENNINSIGRGGSFAPVRCMQLLAAIITNSKDLQEIDIFGNDIGQVAGRVILEGILARKDNSLPKIGVRVTHLLNQDTYDMICKLAPKPKPKKKKAGRR